MHARGLERREPVRTTLGVVARRYQDPELAVGPRRELALAQRLGRHPEKVERLGHLGRVGIPVEEPSEQCLGLRVVAGAQREGRGEQQRARCQAALAEALGDADGRRACSIEIAGLRQGLGEEEADVVADRTLPRPLVPELAEERLRLTPLVGEDGARPRALGLGRDRRMGPQRPGDGRAGRHEQRAEDDQAQRVHPARRSPREEDPLERGQVRQDREDPEGGLEEVEERAHDEADHPLRALHHPHGALDVDRLGPRLRIAHHHRPDQARHRDDRPARVRRPGEEHDDAEEHDEVRVAVDDRVEKGAERRHLARDAGERTVEEIAESGRDQEDPRRARAAGGKCARRQEAHTEADDRQVVGAQAQAEQGTAHWIGPRADALAVAPQHRQIGCASACSSPARTRSRASASSIIRPSRSCT